MDESFHRSPETVTALLLNRLYAGTKQKVLKQEKRHRYLPDSGSPHTLNL